MASVHLGNLEMTILFPKVLNQPIRMKHKGNIRIVGVADGEGNNAEVPPNLTFWEPELTGHSMWA